MDDAAYRNMELYVVCLLLLLGLDWGEGAPVVIASSETASEDDQAFARVRQTSVITGYNSLAKGYNSHC